MRYATRQFLLWFGLLETFVFTGNILGWAALHYMLINEGIYSDRCSNNDLAKNTTVWNDTIINQKPKTCEEQDRILNLAYTIGSFCMGSTSFIWGFLLDKWGMRTVRLIINALITCGCLLLSFITKETSFLLFPAMILMCLAGVPLRLANMEIADLFPEKRSTIITLYSGAFSASASVFVFIKYGYDFGLPWEWACFMLVALSVAMLPVTLFVLPADKIGEQKSGLFAVGDKELSTVAPCVWGTFTYILDDTPFQRALSFRDKKDANQKNKEKQKEKEAEAKPKDSISLRECLFSASYLLHQYWFCWLILYTIIYVGTLHLWMERTSDAHKYSMITEIYGLFQVSGLFLAPFAGMFMDWSIRRVLNDDMDPEETRLRVIRSTFWPMFLTTLLEAVAQVCRFYNDIIAVYISIVAVSLLRVFFLSIGTAYLRLRFPPEHFNKMLGIMSTVSAIVSLFQFPLFLWESSPTNSVLYVNIFYSVCLVIAFIHPLLLVITPLQRYFIRGRDTDQEKM